MRADPVFVGPLRAAEQAWADQALAADNAATLRESAAAVIRRREARVADGYRRATTLLLAGDERTALMIGFRTIAEARALAQFIAASPEHCPDCFVLEHCCERHRTDRHGDASDCTDRSPAGSTTEAPARQPEWHRFGANGSTSATG